MKPASLLVLLVLAALVLPTFSARALDPSIFDDDAPLTPALAQLFTDLEAIPAGSTVTDFQHLTLFADLIALPPGPAAPTAADLDALAGDFGKLAVAGLVNNDAEYLLALDFEVDPDDADSWLTYIQGDLDYLLNPPPPYDPNAPGDGTGDPNLPLETAVPTISLAGDVPRPTRFVTRFSTDLAPVYHDAPGQVSAAYSGTLRLKTYHFRGVEPSSTILVSTVGLPLHDTYTLTAVRQSDGIDVVVGKFRVHGSGQLLSTPLFASSKDLTLSDYQPLRPQIDSRSAVVFGGNSKRLLPTGFNPIDFTRVKVTDSQGRVILTRKFSSPKARTGQVRRTTVSLSSGAPAYSYGIANALYKTVPGQTTRSTFHFSARQLPADTALTLTIDGVTMGQYITASDGRLVIEQGLPPRTTTPSGKPLTINPLQTDGSDLSNMKAVSLTDAQGTVLLTGGF